MSSCCPVQRCKAPRLLVLVFRQLCSIFEISHSIPSSSRCPKQFSVSWHRFWFQWRPRCEAVSATLAGVAFWMMSWRQNLEAKGREKGDVHQHTTQRQREEKKQTWTFSTLTLETGKWHCRYFLSKFSCGLQIGKRHRYPHERAKLPAGYHDTEFQRWNFNSIWDSSAERASAQARDMLGVSLATEVKSLESLGPWLWSSNLYGYDHVPTASKDLERHQSFLQAPSLHSRNKWVVTCIICITSSLHFHLYYKSQLICFWTDNYILSLSCCQSAR